MRSPAELLRFEGPSAETWERLDLDSRWALTIWVQRRWTPWLRRDRYRRLDRALGDGQDGLYWFTAGGRARP